MEAFTGVPSWLIALVVAITTAIVVLSVWVEYSAYKRVRDQRRKRNETANQIIARHKKRSEKGKKRG